MFPSKGVDRGGFAGGLDMHFAGGTGYMGFAGGTGFIAPFEPASGPIIGGTGLAEHTPSSTEEFDQMLQQVFA
jgi:hypothetical protein